MELYLPRVPRIITDGTENKNRRGTGKTAAGGDEAQQRTDSNDRMNKAKIY
jgi:hypothetical protein